VFSMASGGRGGIRTHGTLAGTPVFKTGALNHSATLPAQEFQSLSVGLARTQCERGSNLDPIPSFCEEACGEGDWPGSHAPATVVAFSPDACLAEQNCQQARAQEHEAGRRQNKESVGDNVVVAHDTPTTSDARPNLLKLSESPVGTAKPFLCPKAARVARPAAVQNSSSGTIAFKCMG
jgi:hypothetical protein